VCPGSLSASLPCYPLNFTYQEAASFSKFNAGTVRVNKRLTKGFAVGANYQWSHSIDDAGSEGSVGGVGVQDWQDVQGELGNSSLDVRHQVSGTYLYELPFGQDKTWVTTGVGAHILEGFSVSGSFDFATGTWLSPSYAASVLTTNCGTGGAFRPDRVPNVSLTQGGGSLHQWFNIISAAGGGDGREQSVPVRGVRHGCAEFDRGARNGFEQYGALKDHADGRHAEHGDSGDDQ
jgi:hypothetical protein